MLCSVSYEVLVSCYLSCSLAAIMSVAFACVCEPKLCECCCRSIFFNSTDPSLELVTCAGRSCRNINRFIDLDVLTLINQSAIIVIVPVDVCEDFLVFLDVLGSELDVELFVYSIAGIYDIYLLSVALIDLECVAREYCLFSIFISACFSIPLLDYPVAEYFLCVSCCSAAACDCLSLICVVIRICWCSGSLSCIVDDLDSLGTIELAAPLCIQIELADD